MKAIRLLLSALVVCTLFGASAHAQRNPDQARGPREMPDARRLMPAAEARAPMERRTPVERPVPLNRVREPLGPRLDLSVAQRSELTSLQQQHRDSLDAIKHDRTLSSRVKRTKAADLAKSYEGQRRLLLTAEQNAKADLALAKAKKSASATSQREVATADKEPTD